MKRTHLSPDLTTSQRVKTIVLAQINHHVKDRGISPIRFMENAALQKINGVNPDWVFKSGDKIKVKQGKFICVCADYTYAIFAPVSGGHTEFKNMFAFSNIKGMTDESNYERI